MALDADDIKAIKDLLEPISNDLSTIKVDVHAIRTHTDSINARLYKLENRVANIEVLVDRMARVPA